MVDTNNIVIINLSTVTRNMEQQNFHQEFYKYIFLITAKKFIII